jgi:putative heme-binding domain-containing protein
VEQTQVRPGEIDPAVKTRLQKHPNRTTRTRATTLFADSKTGRRADVVAAYGSSLEKAGDVARGETVFQKACLACHKRGDLGASDVGPDLATVTDHPPEKLLANILDPNLDIQPGYHAYHCELRSGEQLFGLIAGESASGITLKQLDGTNRNLLRNEIVSLKTADVSLMPEGLEASITIEEMADLIAFLKAR